MKLFKANFGMVPVTSIRSSFVQQKSVTGKSKGFEHYPNFYLKLCIAFILIGLIVTACQTSPAPTISPLATTSPLNTPVAELLPTVPLDPTPTPKLIPTPGANVATVYGIMLGSNMTPLANMPVYLGKYDGVLVEISLNHSPKTITDNAGNFVFPGIPPNDDTYQYAVGIILGDSSGSIIQEPDSTHTFVFDVVAGEIVDLGLLRSEF